MSGYLAYTRVSTVKQGDGVSLEAQRDAISAYAAKHGLVVGTWYEEKETAAKRGRPVFNEVISRLRRGDGAGLIVHKIDRSARNFADWALVGELLDQNIDVRFAHESLDLRSRGGRLTADIQAVIAADYVRNLREECLKGIEGRLKQGLFPFAAPIGYLDQGAGKPKALDPERAPFVRQAFELYVTQQYSLRGLLAELRQRGFRNRSGKPITKGCLEILLNNPFYHGEILMKRSARRYQGVHEPIITRNLFKLVQELKSDRQHKKHTRHNHTYRRLITCGECQRNLIGELQKGRVYMRCHTKGCSGKSIRVDQVEAEIGSALDKLEVSEKDYQVLRTRLQEHINKHNPEADAKALELQMSSVDARLEKLTDALLDGLIDKETFQQRKERLVDERQQLEENRAKVGSVDLVVGRVEKFLELVKNLSLTYEIADPTKKRRIAEVAFSNRILVGKYLVLEPQNWLEDVDGTLSVLCGGADRDRSRTAHEISSAVESLATNEEVV